MTISGLTAVGLKLLTASQTGTKIEFTGLKIGDGQITADTKLSSLSDLINPVASIDIEATKIIEEENVTSLKVTGHVHQVEKDYYFRELGLFAINPETGAEVLYAYLNKEDNATLIPKVSSDTAVQELVSMIVAIGNADNIIVNCPNELKIVEQVEGNGGYSLFDVVYKDHILDYSASEGLSLQGTFVYKTAIEGERYGYEDFYNQCITEKNAGTPTKTVLNGTTVATYNNANGHVYYDIADKDAVDTFYNATGCAWFYGIDEENERIFLPRNDWYFKASSDNPGQFIDAGLPDLFPPIAGYSYKQPTGGKGKLSIGSGRKEKSEYLESLGTVTKTPAVRADYSKKTVQPKSVTAKLYIVVGNVRQKTGLVINAGLNNAIEKLNNKALTLEDDLTAVKNSAVSDIDTAKTNAVADVQTEATKQKNDIDALVTTAGGYADNAKNSADTAKKYAELAIDGQLQADWNTTNEKDVTFIKNKPDIAQIAGDEVSDFASTLAPVATSGRYSHLTETPTFEGAKSVTVIKTLKSTVTVDCTNEGLNVTTAYTPTAEDTADVGSTVYTFTYNGTNWVQDTEEFDDNGNQLTETVNLADYKITVTGTPETDNVITLTVSTADKYTISYDDTDLREAIAKIHTFSIKLVDKLPATGEDKIIYLVPKTGKGNDAHDEYIWVDGKFELIGCTEADFSNYYNKTEVDAKIKTLQDQIDSLTAQLSAFQNSENTEMKSIADTLDANKLEEQE